MEEQSGGWVCRTCCSAVCAKVDQLRYLESSRPTILHSTAALPLKLPAIGAAMSSGIQHRHTCELQKELEKAGILRDVVPKVLADVALTVRYGDKPVKIGHELTPKEAAEEPEVTIHSDGATFTLMLVDPDAPGGIGGDHKWRHFLHWLVVNIPGPAVMKGEALAPYKGPTPPEGKHRYVFLLWKQLGEVRASAVEQRKGWNPVDFAKAHNLAEAPSACVFFYSQPS